MQGTNNTNKATLKHKITPIVAKENATLKHKNKHIYSTSRLTTQKKNPTE